MMTTDEDITSKGVVTGRQGIEGPLNRTSIITDLGAAFPISPFAWRIWDAVQTPLTTAATDDMGVSAGAFATGCPYLHAGDMNAAGAITRYARTFYQLPINYVAGGACKLNFSVGMLTSVCSVSATIDAEVYVHARTTLISGSDLVTTSATSMNSTTFADKTFTITPTGLVPGTLLDIRITIAANSATASAHYCAIAAVEMLLDVKG